MVKLVEDEDDDEHFKLRKRSSRGSKILGNLEQDAHDSDLELDYEQDRNEVEQKMI